MYVLFFFNLKFFFKYFLKFIYHKIYLFFCKTLYIAFKIAIKTLKEKIIS